MRNVCLLFAALSLSSAMAASKAQTNPELVEKVERAIAKFEQTERQHWAYTLSRFENEEGEITSSIERFEPNLQSSDNWFLEQINGETPTAKQQREFKDKKREQAQKKQNKEKKGSEKKGKNNFSIALRELILADTLHFVTESPSHIEMGFDVQIEKLGDEASEQLQGQLSYNKQNAFIEEIEITNRGEFSPMFSAMITELKLNLYFTMLNGQVLPTQKDMIMKGTFAFFTEIDEVSSDTFSDYRYMEP